CSCPAATPDLCGSTPDTFCTNKQTDTKNCGTCARACDPGLICSSGVCVANCGATFTACPAGAPTYCAQLGSDVNNCGGCGTVCLSGSCVDGGCVPTAFNSTGAEGAYSPTVSATLPGGIHNFTTINIPAGVTITIAAASNTGILDLRATGNVNIAGTIDLSGG